MAYAKIIRRNTDCKNWCTVIRYNDKKKNTDSSNSSTLTTGYQADSSAAEGNGGCEMKQTDKKKYKKRGNPFKRGNTWTYIIYVPNEETGKKKPVWVGGFFTKEEAENELKLKETEILKGEYVEESTLSFNEYSEIFINDYLDPSVRPQTVELYRNSIKHANKVFKNKPLNKIKIKDIVMLNNYLVRCGLKQITIGNIHSRIKAIFANAVLFDELKKNPYEKYKYKRGNGKHKFYIPTYEEMQKILELCKEQDLSFYLQVLMAVGLGLRRGEILGVSYSDFSIENKTVHVQRQITYHKIDRSENSHCVKEISPLKTEGSDRIVPVPDDILELVKEKELETKKQCLKLGIPFSKDYLVFHHKNDPRKITEKCLTNTRRTFKILLKKNNLPVLRFHDLRHIYATYCLNNGISLKTISKLLGHTSVSTTANIYCESTTEINDAKNVISELICI